jgi:integrase
MRWSKLTAMRVKSISTPGRYADGGNLFLQVSRVGTKSWLFRYMRNGQARAMGLGSVKVLSLARARAKATACRSQLADDIDPIEARRAARKSAQQYLSRTVSFRHCAERYIAAHEAAWKSQKHREQWGASLELHVYPIFDAVAVSAIDTNLVMQVLEPLWNKRPKTAERIRGRIERILSWAKVRGYRHGENPALWRGHLDQLLPATRKISNIRHHAALPYQHIGTFLAKLRQTQWLATSCIEFLVLTAARSGEARGARWEEIDLPAKTWIIPASRMKSNREHRVPLSDRATELLLALPRFSTDNLVFGGGNEGEALHDRTLTLTLRRLNYGHITIHGFRSTFRDWAAEQTSYPREVAEAALAHVNADRVEAAYRRSDLFDLRRQLMAQWAVYCDASVLLRVEPPHAILG